MFASRRDARFVVPLLVAPAVAALVLLAAWNAGVWSFQVGALIGLIVSGLLALNAMSVSYQLQDGELTVKMGLVKLSLPVASILSVTPTENPVSAPALSIFRLAIEYHRGDRPRVMLISPADRSAFLEALRRVDPQLEPLGDGLRRTKVGDWRL